MIGSIQIILLMMNSLTPTLCSWSVLAFFFINASLFAQTTPDTQLPVERPQQAPILMDFEGYPLLYTNLIDNAANSQRFGGDTPDPRDVLVNDPLDLSGGHTMVNSSGQVINSITSSCPKLLVDVNIPFIQSCLASTAVLTYCNHGGEDAFNAYVEVRLDSNLQLDSASFTYVPLSANLYRIDLGTVLAGVCASIDLHLTTACDPALLGATHCIDAHIFPDTLCTAVQNRPLLEVNGECLGNALRFSVRNHGTTVTASQHVSFTIIDDHLIAGGQRRVIQSGSLQINRHGKFITIVPVAYANHMDYKMEVRDSRNDIIAIAFVELCAPNPAITPIYSDFYANYFWNGSALPFTDRGCGVNGKSVTNASLGNGTTTIATEDDNDDDTSSDAATILDDIHLQVPVEVQIAPNPVGAIATISLKGAEDVIYLFELYSVTGQLVRTLAVTGNSSKQLARQNLPAGFYVYRVSAKGMPLQEGKILMR